MCGRLIYLISCVLVLVLAGTGMAGNIDPDLVGWWTFDDGVGSVAKDLSGKSTDAALIGNVSWGQESPRRGILLLDGTENSGDTWEYAFIDGEFFEQFGESFRIELHSQVFGCPLQFAVFVGGAVGAIDRMAGQQQFKSGSGQFLPLFSVCIYNHSFGNRRSARRL